MTAEPPVKPDFNQEITDKLIQMLEEGQAGEFVLPWHRVSEPLGLPVNAKTGKAYQGGNIPSLWLDGMMKGFGSNEWASDKQWRELHPDAKIKPEHRKNGSLIHFVKQMWVPPEKRTGNEEEDMKHAVPIMRTYWIYNREQMDGVPEKEKVERPNLVETVQVANDYFDNLNMRLVVGEKQYAAYSQALDKIVMPSQEAFVGTENATATQSWYSTLFHEAGHATAHPSRVNRDTGNIADKPSYAREEMVAEFIAAITCAKLGIANNPDYDQMDEPNGIPKRDGMFDRAAYLNNWLQVLRDDPNALAEAATKARKAVDWMEAQQPLVIEVGPDIAAKVKAQVESGKLVEAGGVLATPATAEKIEASLTLTQDRVSELKAEGDAKFADRFKNRRALGDVIREAKEAKIDDPFVTFADREENRRLTYTREDVER